MAAGGSRSASCRGEPSTWVASGLDGAGPTTTAAASARSRRIGARRLPAPDVLMLLTNHQNAIILSCMRTTLTLDDDVAAAVEDLRRAEGIGRSEAVNRLVRKGLISRDAPVPYQHLPSDMGPFKVDISNIGAVVELLDHDG